MEKSLRATVRIEPDDEHHVVVVCVEERVHGHHPTTFGRSPAPHAADLLELDAKLHVQLARVEDTHDEARALEPVHRLPDLSDRPAVEGERRRIDHRLVTVIERPEAERPVEPQALFAHAEHGDPPPVLVSEVEKAVHELFVGCFRPDRIAPDDRYPTCDAVREERRAVR